MKPKSIRQLLFTLATILSLALLAATAALWVRSYRIVDHFSYDRWERFHAGHRISISSDGGRLVFGSMNLQGAIGSTGRPDAFVPYGEFRHDTVPAGPNVVDLSTYPSAYRRMFAKWSGGYGFAYFEFRRSRGWGVCAPCWAPATLFAACPLAACVRLARRRRKNAGLCTACGYNLTGNVSGVCPECGVEIRGGKKIDLNVDSVRPHSTKP